MANESIVWWRADLGKKRPIHHVNIKFFQDSGDNSVPPRRPGFSVAITNETSNYPDTNSCYKDQSDNGDQITEVSLMQCSGIGQHITVYNQRGDKKQNDWSRYANLQLAEVEIMEDIGCSDGTWGQKCDQECGKCQDGKCSRDGGKCEGNCIEGWYGEKCDTPCSEFCAGCDQTSGKCTACVGGNRRSGEMCDQCPQCLNNQCHVNGTCKVSCADKTQHGDNCDIPCSVTIKDCVECESVNNNALCSKCVDGLYGSRCMEKCPDNCESCDNDTLCTECMKGYSGPTCSAICKHDHCSHCNVSGDCLKCEKGFFYEKYQKKICVSCTNITELSNCYDCESYVKCIECQPGFYLKSANQCEKCPDHCLECSSESTCSKCELEWSGVSCKCGPYCNQTSTLADWCIETNGSCTKGCSGENYTSTCDKHCPGIDCLVCTQNDGQCLQCVSGKYGQYTSCSDNCGHCLDGICDIRDGTCKGACHNTYHGDKCNQTCPANCNSTDCVQITGACFGCIGGFFGDKCDQTCPANCNSTDCKQSTGACSGCKKGFFGDKCDQECNANCLDSNFVHGCQQQDGNCKNCKPGFYGDKCEQKCNPKCRYDGGASGCRKSDGRCHSCEDGYYSLSCELNCSANCISKCDKDSGHCFGCKSVFYGPFCNKSCPNNCAINCDQDSGKCFGCKPGSYGFKCTDICSRTCAVEGPVADCAQDDGTCVTCPFGKNGRFCNKTCPGFCARQDGEKGTGPCDQMTGVCIHNCQVGYHNDTCNVRCNDGCQGMLCNRETAECLNGCAEGFTGTNCAKQMDQGDGTLIIILVVVLVVILAAAAVIFFIFRRRLICKKKGQTNETPLKRLHSSPEEKETLIKGRSKKDIIPIVPKRSSRLQNGTTDVEDGFGITEENPLLGPEEATKPEDYYNLSSRIKVQDFAFYLKNRRNQDPNWFKEEFKKLPSGLLKEAKDSGLPANRGKCRYKMLYPYDDTRVRLESDGDQRGDFINASYMNGYKKPQAFIAAQGPTDTTLADFWRMIWQQGCDKIVMLTNLFEECKMKCVKYWPDTDKPEVYGNYEVTMVTETCLPNYTIRNLEATLMSTKEVKDFTMYHYTSWPDRNVPDNPGVILTFKDKVMEGKVIHGGPILVHCSAGIGRTGTFIALDFLIQQAKEEPDIDVFRTVTDMRYQRANFVQTDIQYEFLHNAILEALTVKDHEVTMNQFVSYCATLLENDRELLRHQYNTMNEMSPVLEARNFQVGSSDENVHKNRDPTILPPDMSRAYLSTPVKGSNEYINAVFIPTSLNKKGFLLTQMPLPHTVTDFWRLVYDQHIRNVVMMNNVDDDDETIGEYWPLDDSVYGPFHVELLSCENNDDDFLSIMNIHLTYKSLSHESKMTVKLFRFEGWPDKDPVPLETRALTSLISRVAHAPRDSPQESVIVHCMNGADRSGLYCVLSDVLERLQSEQKVNIPQCILQMRHNRPQIISSEDQFEFVYRAVAEYIDSTQIYSNAL
ncbi:uncharacterized protein LOC128213461 isoform X2 [Mya arenaria]|nr:uncharacterized protein LOC128213461 isoform X2 [Mya arenaria]